MISLKKFLRDCCATAAFIVDRDELFWDATEPDCDPDKFVFGMGRVYRICPHCGYLPERTKFRTGSVGGTQDLITGHWDSMPSGRVEYLCRCERCQQLYTISFIPGEKDPMYDKPVKRGWIRR